MNGSALIYTVRWLIYDTFRQALTGRIFWIMLGVSALFIVFCLGTTIESNIEYDPETREHYIGDSTVPYTPGNPNGKGSISLLFGFMPDLDWNRPVREAVQFMQMVLAGFVAGFFGILLALILTAGFVPEFLQPNSASVLLAKPVPRWTIITGKYLGVLAFMIFQIVVFFFGTWLALSLRTGIWEYAYLVCIPLLILEFAILFSFTVFIAAWTRSTTACILGSILFLLVCWGMNVGRHFVVGIDIAAPEVTLGPITGFLTEVGYWILPKPADILILNEQALGAETLARQGFVQRTMEKGAFLPELSILASLIFTVVMLGIAARQLAETDY